MTAGEYRAAALALPEAVESAHGGHPDFRVGGRIFATLTADGSGGALKLRTEQRELLMAVMPGALRPAAGAWGARGWTLVSLPDADAGELVPALRMAWANAAPARLRRAHMAEGDRP